MLYVQLSVQNTGPRSGESVLQLHPALDLLHCRPVIASVQILQLQLIVHWVILLG